MFTGVRAINTIGIVAKLQYRPQEMRRIITDLRTWLTVQEQGLSVLLDAETATLIGEAARHSRSDLPSHVDLIVVLGGDGTLLAMARMLQGRDVPLLGVNVGGLGFLTETPAEEARATLLKILRREYVLDTRRLLAARIRRDEATVVQSTALNDVVVSKGALARLIRLEVRVEGQPIMTLRGDGLITATPTGSTAYSLSAGGPIVHSSMDAILLTPISSHTLTNRPIVLPGQFQVEVMLIQEDDALVIFDGQATYPFRKGDTLTVWTAKETLHLARATGRTDFDALRNKLKWGEA